MHRTFRAGEAKGTGYLEDYADVAHGLLELHVATGDLRWLREANRLARLAVELFADEKHGGFFLSPADGEVLVARKKDLEDHPTPSGNSMLAYVLLRLARLAVDLFADEERGGFFLSPVDGEKLVARKKDLEDHPTPSGNSMLAYVLLRLARIYGDDELEQQATGVFRLVHGAATRVPSAFGHALTALELHFSPPREIAIVGPVDSPVARGALEPFQPDTVVAVGPAEDVPLLAGKHLVDGQPAVYICENFACQAPVTSYEAFTAP